MAQPKRPHVRELTAAVQLGLVLGVFGAQPPAPIETITVIKDDTVITSSCRVVIPPGTVIQDRAGDGAIQVRGDGITVEFAPGSELSGAASGVEWDSFRGIGVRVEGGRNVSLRGLRVRGYKGGVVVSGCNGVSVTESDLSDNFRQRLKSTPWAEDGSDWLYPHHNDKNEWLEKYGAALYLEDLTDATVQGVRVRRGQNGIILDRVNRSVIARNDCSYLSGWGVAMWRSGGNEIVGNLLDFCMRGYSDGVYSRGQDSAGLLIFEQSSNNLIAFNSMTHGGDGIFGFAGFEAIGEIPAPAPDFDYKGRGSNNNHFIDNDLSFAAAHGLEMTFSHGNVIARNTFRGNGFSGVWAGYCQETLIAGNEFERNGELGRGLERGGICIEHGSNNTIYQNTFREQSPSIHLWWDDDGRLFEFPGVKANYKGVFGNTIGDNAFFGGAVAVEMQDRGTGHFKSNRVFGSVTTGVDTPLEAIENAGTPKVGPMPGEPDVTEIKFSVDLPDDANRAEVRSRARPKVDRPGRSSILMTEWGPWEGESPFARLEKREADRHVYSLWRMDTGYDVVLEGEGVRGTWISEPRAKLYEVRAEGSGVRPYVLKFAGAEGYRPEFRGLFVSTVWDVVFFPWAKENDPREHADAWRTLAQGDSARRITLAALNFPFGGVGPSQLKIAEEITRAALKPDFFGMVASTNLDLPKGKWRIRTLSDDGVRVKVNGKTVIERWDLHVPTPDEAVIAVDRAGATRIEVEYFEIQGHAVFSLELEPAGD